MEVRPGANPNDVKNYDTDRLRHDFLIQDVFVPGEIKTIYSQIDRIIVGAATPAKKTLKTGRQNAECVPAGNTSEADSESSSTSIFPSSAKPDRSTCHASNM